MTLRFKDVRVLDMCQCLHRHDTDTCGYIQLFYFLKLLVSMCKCMCFKDHQSQFSTSGWCAVFVLQYVVCSHWICKQYCVVCSNVAYKI
jgi:hypothetical protein